MNAIHTIANEEDGLRADVYEIDKGYSVVLFDTDAGESTGLIRIFPPAMKAEAITYAGTII